MIWPLLCLQESGWGESGGWAALPSTDPFSRSLISQRWQSTHISLQASDPSSSPWSPPWQSKGWDEWGDVLSFLEWAGTGKSLLADEYISEAQLSKQRKCFTETNAMSLNPPWEQSSQHQEQLFTPKRFPPLPWVTSGRSLNLALVLREDVKARSSTLCSTWLIRDFQFA